MESNVSMQSTGSRHESGRSKSQFESGKETTMKKLLVLAIVMLASQTGSAGVLFEVESTFGGSTTQTNIAVEGMRMKMDAASGAEDWDGEMIFDADNREMVVIDHDKKTYFVIDEEQMRQLGETVNQAMASMEQALAALPESQRAQMEQMMKSRMPDMGSPREPSELEKTGETDTVNGYPCVKYIVMRGGAKERELWVTDWDNVAGGREVADAFLEMGAFMTEMLDSLPKVGDRSFGDATYEHMKEIGGFPVRTLEYGDDGILDGQSDLISSKNADFEATDFEPPKKYKRKDMMKGMK
jgi:hypothetical protein